MMLPLLLLAAASIADGQAVVVNTANFINCLSIAANAYANNCNYDGINSGGLKFIDPFYQNSWTSGYAQTYPMNMQGPTFGGYTNIVATNPTPQTFATLQADNYGNCDQPMPLVINQAVTYQQSSSWSLSATVTISDTISETMGIPAEDSVSDSTTISVSTTASTSSTTTSTFEQQVTSTFTADPGQNLQATLMINAETITADFTYSYSFSGTLPIWINNRVDAVCFNINPWGPNPPPQSNMHYNWFVDINNVMSDSLTLAANGGDPSGYCTGFTPYAFNGNGVFDSNKGIAAVAAANTLSQADCPSGRKLFSTNTTANKRGTKYQIFTDDANLMFASARAKAYLAHHKLWRKTAVAGLNETAHPEPKFSPRRSPAHARTPPRKSNRKSKP